MSMIFVFGSNEAGIHGAGAALHAVIKYEAEYGIPFGPTGNSFAIPTKDKTIKRTLPLLTINLYVEGFLAYARKNLETKFQITCIGCGLAGLKHEDIAPMFNDAPINCFFDELWRDYLPRQAKFWGTF
jgi:hypothetical protein